MKRFFPAFAGLVLILAGGLVHGWWTDRWGISNEPAASAARLADVPKTIGDWVSDEGTPIGKNDLAIGEIDGYLSRVYKNRGTVLSVLMVCGRPGAISVHTPDVCFVGGGQKLLDMNRRQISLNPPDPPLDCFVAHFRRAEADRPLDTRVIWSWSADGAWKAPTHPRFSFYRARSLYKLYVVRAIANKDEPTDADPAVDFLKVFVPELEKTLFQKPPAQAVPGVD